MVSGAVHFNNNNHIFDKSYAGTFKISTYEIHLSPPEGKLPNVFISKSANGKYLVRSNSYSWQYLSDENIIVNLKIVWNLKKK